MALSFTSNPLAQNNAPKAGAQQQQQDAPKAEVYLNVGVTISLPNAEGVEEELFVSLPFGLALDTMNEAQMRGSSADYHQLVQAKNQLLAALQKQAETLESGQEEPVPYLEVRARRTGAVAEPKAGENPILAAMTAKGLSLVA